MARLELKGNVLRRQRGRRPLEVAAWAEKHRINVGMAADAQQIATMVEVVLDFMRLVGSAGVQRAMPALPDAAVWFTLYERPFDLYRVVGNKASRSNYGTRAVREYQETAAAIDLLKNPPRKPRRRASESKRRAAKNRRRVSSTMNGKAAQRAFARDLARWLKAGRKAYREHLDELREELGIVNEPVRDDLGKQLARSPEMYFALRVLLPCVVHFNTTPARLFEAAKAGDGNAIESLVRLDSRMAGHPVVDRWAYGCDGPASKQRVGMVAQWQAEGITKALSSVEAKRSAAGLISVLADAKAFRITQDWQFQRYKLTAPMILDLLHAAARDHGTAGEYGRDPDLRRTGGEAWSRCVLRHRAPWVEGLGLRPDTPCEN